MINKTSFRTTNVEIRSKVSRANKSGEVHFDYARSRKTRTRCEEIRFNEEFR